jgi:hypothetical protein
MKRYPIDNSYQRARNKPKRTRLKAVGLVIAWPALMVIIPLVDVWEHGGGMATLKESASTGIHFVKATASFAFLPWELTDG